MLLRRGENDEGPLQLGLVANKLQLVDVLARIVEEAPENRAQLGSLFPEPLEQLLHVGQEREQLGSRNGKYKRLDDIAQRNISGLALLGEGTLLVEHLQKSIERLVSQLKHFVAGEETRELAVVHFVHMRELGELDLKNVMETPRPLDTAQALCRNRAHAGRLSGSCHLKLESLSR